MVVEQDIGPIRQNTEKKAQGDTMRKERTGPPSREREALYEGERGLGQGQPLVEVVGDIKGRQ